MITENVYPQTKLYTSSHLDEPLKGKTGIFSDLSVPFQRNNAFVLPQRFSSAIYCLLLHMVTLEWHMSDLRSPSRLLFTKRSSKRENLRVEREH